MSIETEKAEVVDAVTKRDIDYIHRRLDQVNEDRRALDKKIRTVVAILVDKKLIGEGLAKTFFESKKVNLKKYLEWFEKTGRLSK